MAVLVQVQNFVFYCKKKANDRLGTRIGHFLIKAEWWDAPLALWDLAQAVRMI